VVSFFFVAEHRNERSVRTSEQSEQGTSGGLGAILFCVFPCLCSDEETAQHKGTSISGMDTLRPSVANMSPAALLTKPKTTTTTRQPRRLHELRDDSHAALTPVKPSPNSFAPALGSSQPPPQQSRIQVPRTTLRDHPPPVQQQQQALPTFLSRRPRPEPTPSTADSSADAAPMPPDSDSDDEEDLLLMPNHEILDDAPLVDDAVFEACLDLDEEEQSEDALKAIAEELSATTGLTHAEVLELLLEQQREKQAMRHAMDKKRKEDAVLRALLPAAAAGATVAMSSDQRDMFLTATPDALERQVTIGVPRLNRRTANNHSTADNPPRPPAPTSAELPPILDALGQNDEQDNGEESSARRMKRQLAELFPDHSLAAAGGESSRRIGGKTLNNDVGDEFVDLQTFRAQRLAKKHAAVSNHLASTRGEVSQPKSLETRDIFVKAYEHEMRKRQAVKDEKEEQLRREREDADKERRMKGFFCNQAIQKKIEERTSAPAGYTIASVAGGTALGLPLEAPASSSRGATALGKQFQSVPRLADKRK
jgi:hypothetical protein